MTLFRTAVALTSLCLAGLQQAAAADLPTAPAPVAPAFTPAWTVRLTPYAWLISVNGSQAIRGRMTDVNSSFVDIIDTTLENGGTVAALMLHGDARNGPWAVFGDVVWEKITVSPGGLRTRSVAPGISGSVGASLNVGYNMGIVELGGSYELARFGAMSLDVLAGARYWNQSGSLSLDAGGTVDLRDLTLTRDRAIAKSGSVDWLDGFAGVSAHIALAPGQEFLLTGNVGAGGSKFTWEAIAAYSYDFTTKNGVTYSGVLGYKALYADYSQGSGSTRFEYDMLQHGPVIGLTIRF